MKKPGINADWHKKHPMPKKPTLEQRVHWHKEHLKHCSCRNVLPAGLLAEMKKRGMEIPA